MHEIRYVLPIRIRYDEGPLLNLPAARRENRRVDTARQHAAGRHCCYPLGDWETDLTREPEEDVAHRSAETPHATRPPPLLRGAARRQSPPHVLT